MSRPAANSQSTPTRCCARTERRDDRIIERTGGVRRVGLVSVHTSPLDQPGTGDGGGLNVYVRQIMTGLVARGIEVDVFTRRTDPDLPPTIDVNGAQVHHIDAGPARPVGKDAMANLLCAYMIGIQRHPTMGRHDLFHTHYWLSGWVGRRIAQRRDVPFVHTFHTLGVLKNAHLAPGEAPESPLRLVAEERIARDADRLLVLTCGEARLLHEAYGLGGQHLTVVRAGVDLERFHPAKQPAPTAFAAGRGGPRLLFVGRLQPLKGPDLAVRILAEVRRSHPDAELEIIGGLSGRHGHVVGPDVLRRLAHELGVADGLTISPALPQEQLVDRYRASDVVVVPSRSETFGLVALEAQASGVPVVATRVGGLTAVVADTASLVAGHDPVDHARAVVRLLDDPQAAATAREVGLAKARRTTWDATVTRLVDAYGEVVRARSMGPQARQAAGGASRGASVAV